MLSLLDAHGAALSNIVAIKNRYNGGTDVLFFRSQISFLALILIDLEQPLKMLLEKASANVDRKFKDEMVNMSILTKEFDTLLRQHCSPLMRNLILSKSCCNTMTSKMSFLYKGLYISMQGLGLSTSAPAKALKIKPNVATLRLEFAENVKSVLRSFKGILNNDFVEAIKLDIKGHAGETEKLTSWVESVWDMCKTTDHLTPKECENFDELDYFGSDISSVDMSCMMDGMGSHVITEVEEIKEVKDVVDISDIEIAEENLNISADAVAVLDYPSYTLHMHEYNSLNVSVDVSSMLQKLSIHPVEAAEQGDCDVSNVDAVDTAAKDQEQENNSETIMDTSQTGNRVFYHGACYQFGVWLCCRNVSEDAVGCCSVSSEYVEEDGVVTERHVQLLHPYDHSQPPLLHNFDMFGLACGNCGQVFSSQGCVAMNVK